MISVFMFGISLPEVYSLILKLTVTVVPHIPKIKSIRSILLEEIRKTGQLNAMSGS